MSGIKNQDGFTLVEILVALGIMALGFMAMAEMQFLSLRQKQLAERGTIATNTIQFVSDRDMAEVKRLYLLNSIAYIKAQAASLGPSDLDYCNGSATSACDACPCDPLEVLTPNPTDGTTESTCSIVDIHNFDPDKLNFRTSNTQCKADANADPNTTDWFIVKQATTTQAPDPTSGLPILTVAITYAVKTPAQFDDTGLTSVSIKDSLASQTYQVTAHVDNYSNFIPGWNEVRVPHIP